jgi:hypothetical protein
MFIVLETVHVDYIVWHTQRVALHSTNRVHSRHIHTVHVD